VGIFVFLLVLLQVKALRYAYMSVGFSAGGAMLVLLGSLAGSYFNIPPICFFRRDPTLLTVVVPKTGGQVFREFDRFQTLAIQDP
jgi:uncharacterized membrane protein